MKIAFVLTAAVLTVGAADAKPVAQLGAGHEPGSSRTVRMPNTHALHEAACRDRITLTRAERGLPMLQRDTASPDRPLLIAALDHRIDGCGVLVMRADTNDIRPVPAVPDDQPLLMPAH